MARTSQEIFDYLKNEFGGFPELSALVSEVNNSQDLLTKITTDSQVSIHDLLLWVVSVGNHATEVEVENTLTLILSEMTKRKYGSLPWYAEEAKNFQFGDTVQWLNGKYFYDPVDVEARVIDHAAAVPIVQGVRLKVASLVGGVLAPCSVEVMEALESYFNDQVIGIKPAGIHLIITSTGPDYLKLSIRIIRNPQVINTAGGLVDNPAVKPVEEAINKYIQFLPFNSEFNITKLEDAIQKVTGVIDVEIDSAETKYGAFPYVPVDLKYIADAGYMMIDPAYPLSSSIQYLI